MTDEQIEDLADRIAKKITLPPRPAALGEPGQPYQENEELKRDLAAAIRRAEPAKAVISALRERGDTAALLRFLLAERDKSQVDALQLNREIAAVALIRGEIETAESAIDQVLAISPEDLPALNCKGRAQRIRGRLEGAAETTLRMLHLARTKGDKRWESVACGNLGIIYTLLGEFDQAEAMYRESLDLIEQSDRSGGRAAQYQNLGNLYLLRNQLDHAEALYREALKVNQRQGDKEGLMTNYGSLGIVYRIRGDLTKAEEYHRKALELAKQRGSKEGMAICYANLGNVYNQRGDKAKAFQFWMKAHDLFAQIRASHMVRKTQALMDQVGSTNDEADTP